MDNKDDEKKNEWGKTPVDGEAKPEEDQPEVKPVVKKTKKQLEEEKKENGWLS